MSLQKLVLSRCSKDKCQMRAKRRRVWVANQASRRMPALTLARTRCPPSTLQRLPTYAQSGKKDQPAKECLAIGMGGGAIPLTKYLGNQTKVFYICFRKERKQYMALWACIHTDK